MSDTPKTIDPPQVKTVTATVTATDFQKLWDKGPLSHLQLLVADTLYCVQDEATWLEDFKATGSRFPVYDHEKRDCDNYSVFMAGAVSMQQDVNGVVIVFDTSGAHSYNAVVVVESDGSMTFKIAEPQLDAFVPADKAGTAPYAEKAGFAVAT